MRTTAGRYRRIALGVIVFWFAAGGLGHFIVPEFFLKIVPPLLPLREEAVYVTGLFELLGAVALLFPRSRRAGGLGLFVLTVLVTPANVYMWANPAMFPQIPQLLLTLRLLLQVVLLATIWWATQGPIAKAGLR